MTESVDVHLRMLTSDDAAWLVALDEGISNRFARRWGWEIEKLAAELDEGVWATDEQWGWAIATAGEPAGFAIVRTGTDGVADIELRIAQAYRGQGVGREVLRQLADHHFAANPRVVRMFGRAHELNVPMQRAFNAAGFRMEARYRESFRQADGTFASEWGYALTRADWAAGRHHMDEQGYDLHGLVFTVEQVLKGSAESRLRFAFLQEGRRVLARYSGGSIEEGELAGILANDVLRYRYVEEVDDESGDAHTTLGQGRARLQRRGDGRLEMVNDWTEDEGRHGQTFLVEAEPAEDEAD
ncbi:MAG: GNAT family protein [Nitriliruptorales bacterium]|nr:GNAT family protein [Nitriliruptorales bacterium]